MLEFLFLPDRYLYIFDLKLRFPFIIVFFRFRGQLRETAAVIDIRNSRRGTLFYDYLNPKASSRTAGHD